MDSALRARIAEMQVEIEETGSVGSYIPEEARIRRIKTKYNLEERRGSMNYLKMAERGSKEFRVHQVNFTS